jgi:hypothetical protein
MTEFQKLVQYWLLEKKRASTCRHTIGLYILNDILLLIQHYDLMKVVNRAPLCQNVEGHSGSISRGAAWENEIPHRLLYPNNIFKNQGMLYLTIFSPDFGTVETRGVLGHIGPPKAEAWHLGT